MIDLKDPNQNKHHYTQQNNRVPGAQVEQGWGLDARQQVIARLLSPHTGSVLDLGAADGSLLILLYQSKIITFGVGVDLWADGIKWGQDYCASKHLPISLNVGSVEDYNGITAEVAILGEILEHVIDPVRVLRVAKAHSSAIIVTVPTARPPFTQEELARLAIEPEEHIRQYDLLLLENHCAQAGLKVEQSIMVGSGWVNLVARCVSKN